MHLPITGSIDSFIAAILMAWAGCPKLWQRRIVVEFAVFDMLAGFAGSQLKLDAGSAASAVAAAIVAFALILLRTRNYSVLFSFIPVLLSLDNLALGAADGRITFQSAFSSAVLDGFWSGILAACGFAGAGLAAQVASTLLVSPVRKPE